MDFNPEDTNIKIAFIRLLDSYKNNNYNITVDTSLALIELRKFYDIYKCFSLPNIPNDYSVLTKSPIYYNTNVAHMIKLVHHPIDGLANYFCTNKNTTNYDLLKLILLKLIITTYLKVLIKRAI